MACSGWQISGIFASIVAASFLAVSASTNYWTVDNDLTFGGIDLLGFNRGLVVVCEGGRVTQEILQRLTGESKPNCGVMKHGDHVVSVYELVEIVLIVASILMSTSIALCSFCCCSCWQRCMVSTTLLAAFCSASCIFMYGFYQFSGHMPSPQSVIGKVYNEMKYFGWSYWLAVCGCVAQLVSSMLFGIGTYISRATKVYDHQPNYQHMI